MPQPARVQFASASGLGVSSLTITPGTATAPLDGLMVGVVLDANQDWSLGGISDSQGNDAFGVPLNTWIQMGTQTNNGVTVYWYACRGALSITSVTVSFTGSTNAQAFLIEYAGMNGVGTPFLTTISSLQNTVSTDPLELAVGVEPPSGAAILLSMFTMRNDTFNGTPEQGSALWSSSIAAGPSMSLLVVEQDTVASSVTINGVTNTPLAESFEGELVAQVSSSDQDATQLNLSNCSMQAFYLLISGGLIFNTQPGFADQPDSTLAAGQLSLGIKLAKISSNAAFGMVRMEFFQGLYSNGQTVPLPISQVDGYAYQQDEVVFIWTVLQSGNPESNSIAGPGSLWYMEWNVDQDTGLVTSQEWYRQSDGPYAESNDGLLQVFTIGIRQKSTLLVAEQPSYTYLNPANLTTDAPQDTNTMVAMNESAKFASVAQECLYMPGPSNGGWSNGQTVPAPTSPIDGYAYSYSEVKFIWSPLWTTASSQFTQPAWEPLEQFGAMVAEVSGSGVVTCGIGWSNDGGDGYSYQNTYGAIAVFAFCNRNASYPGSMPTANQFQELPSSLFYSGNPLPAGIMKQLNANINEACLSPEFFGPTLYIPGDTVPTPTSPIDGYAYSRAECTYIWTWKDITTGGSGLTDDPTSYSTSDHVRTARFTGNVDQGSGAVTTTTSRLVPGGGYDNYTNQGILAVLVVGFRTSQQTSAGSGSGSPTISSTGSTDAAAAGPLTVNGV